LLHLSSGHAKVHIAFVGRATAIAASLRSRAVVSVVALRFERAFAIDALVFWIGEADSAYVVVLSHSLHSV
jgi:hypothetical protein